MNDHGFEWYEGLMTELRVDFAPRNNLFDEIDKMVRPEWSLPEDFTAVIKDVMAVVDTAPSDAINSGAIALSGSNPVFNVQPFMANIAEHDRAQRMEDNLSYHFDQANIRGNGTLMYDVAESSLRYNTICVRVDDLAHIFPQDRRKWTPLQKRAWSYGRFLAKAYHPKGIYFLESSNNVLSFIGHEQSFKVQALMEHWKLYENNNTDEGRRVARALRKLEDDLNVIDSKRYPMQNLSLIQTYCLDDDKLVVWAGLMDKDGEAVFSGSVKTAHTYDFVDQENKLGFLNWSIRVAGSRLEEAMEYRVNPLLAPLYWSRAWDKLNLAKSIVYSEPIRRARNPRGVSRTNSGDSPNVDYENGNEINLRVGEDYTPFQPITMDENALAVINALESSMIRTTGASLIGDASKLSSNTPFATYSAMIKVALSRLNKQRDNMALSASDVACLFLWWADKTDLPLTSFTKFDTEYRTGTKMRRGQLIETGSDDYDLNHLGVSSKIIAMTPTDEMEQLNMAVMLSTKLNYPVSKALEKIGYENVGLTYELWAREFLKNAELQAQAAGMLAEAQETAQLTAQQNAQSQKSPAAQPPEGGATGMTGSEEGMSGASFGPLGGTTGVNPAFSGMSPYQGAPSMTRETISGTDRLSQQR